MTLSTTASVLLIAAFLLVIVASGIGPNAVYSAPDSETRLAIIAANQGRWAATNTVWAVSSLMAAVGLILLSVQLGSDQMAWLPYLAAALSTIGLLAWAIYLMQRVADPGAHLYVTPPSIMSLVFVWALTPGLILYGITFLQGAFPSWVGIVLIAAMLLMLVGLVFAFDAIYASFPPQAYWLLTLIIGIVNLRQ